MLLVRQSGYRDNKKWLHHFTCRNFTWEFYPVTFVWGCGRVHHRMTLVWKLYFITSERKIFSKYLVDFLIDSAKVSYGKSHQQVKSVAACGICNKGGLEPNKVLSNGWYNEH